VNLNKYNNSINYIENFYNENGRFPYVSEFDKNRPKNCLNRRSMERNLGMSWNEILRKHFPNKNLNQLRPSTLPSKDNIIKELINLKNKLDRTPMVKEINKDNLTFSEPVIYKVFSDINCFSDFCKMMDWEMIGNENFVESKSDMLKNFYKLYLELGRIPYYKDLDECKYTKSGQSYFKYFDNILNVCNILDIDYKDNYTNKGAGFISFDKNDNMCKSEVELKISNYLIDNDIEFEKETLYKNIIKKDVEWRFDWEILINNKKYYVEYFGMFYNDANRYKKHNILRRYRRKTIKKIKALYKANKINDCIFIFPKDIKNKSLDEIFSKIYE